MNRRNWLKYSAAMLAPASASAPIQLHVDLNVDPAKETELLANYRKIFRPAITKQPGFVDVKLLKLRNAVAGKAPADATHRLLIVFETEEQRQKWVATPEHQRAWPAIEKTLRTPQVNAVLYQVVQQ